MPKIAPVKQAVIKDGQIVGWEIIHPISLRPICECPEHKFGCPKGLEWNSLTQSHDPVKKPLSVQAWARTDEGKAAYQAAIKKIEKDIGDSDVVAIPRWSDQKGYYWSVRIL